MGIFSVAVDYFQRGGIWMWPLLLSSFAAVVIGVERYLYYRANFSSTAFVRRFCALLCTREFDEARVCAEEGRGVAAKLVQDILAVKGARGKAREAIVYAKADRAIDGLEQHLDYLSVIIGLAPMLGLLGTITGMIGSFNALNERLQNPLAVTAGIGEALITTVFGLSIAIFGMCIHAYLAAKVKTASLDLYEVAEALVSEWEENGDSEKDI